MRDEIEEILFLANYLYGYSVAKQDDNIKKASDWLRKLSMHICGAGYIGCPGGPDCDSDHK